jgi:SAM-dependent methyltransferase
MSTPPSSSPLLRRFADRALELPLVYRGLQAPFAKAKLAPFFRHVRDRDVRTVLDVGCGPGTNAAHFAHLDYTGIDINASYIASAHRRFPGRFVVGDVTDPVVLPGGRYDCVLVNSLLHHLDDAAVRTLLQRLGRLVAPGGAVHILDLVMPVRWNVARALARLDRGRHARPLEAWRTIFSEAFAARIFESYGLGLPFVTMWEMVYFEGTPR